MSVPFHPYNIWYISYIWNSFIWRSQPKHFDSAFHLTEWFPIVVTFTLKQFYDIWIIWLAALLGNTKPDQSKLTGLSRIYSWNKTCSIIYEVWVSVLVRVFRRCIFKKGYFLNVHFRKFNFQKRNFQKHFFSKSFFWKCIFLQFIFQIRIFQKITLCF